MPNDEIIEHAHEFSFSPAESELIRALADKSSEVSILLPDHKGNLDVAWKQLELCLQVNKGIDNVSRKLRPIIGRILVWARSNPEFYERKGYRTYDVFIKEYVCGVMGLGRTTLYQERFIAERLPDLTPEELVELGPSRANALAEIVSSKDSNFEEVLARAKNSTAVGLTKWAAEKGMADAGGSMETAAIMIRSNKTVEKMWDEFKEIPEVHAYVGSEKAHLILEKLLMEAYGVWLNPNSPDICPTCNGSGRVFN